VITAGTFYEREGRTIFWFDELVVEVSDPSAVVEQIQAKLSK
jgi:hypothetical protein